MDGWIPAQKEKRESGYEGHEALIILNCNDTEVRCWFDFYFEDRAPIENVETVIPAKRVKCFRMDKKEEIGGVELGRLCQYSLRVRSRKGSRRAVRTHGRDAPNCSYIGLMGYSE